MLLADSLSKNILLQVSVSCSRKLQCDVSCVFFFQLFYLLSKFNTLESGVGNPVVEEQYLFWPPQFQLIKPQISKILYNSFLYHNCSFFVTRREEQLFCFIVYSFFRLHISHHISHKSHSAICLFSPLSP